MADAQDVMGTTAPAWGQAVGQRGAIAWGPSAVLFAVDDQDRADGTVREANSNRRPGEAALIAGNFNEVRELHGT